MANANLWLKRSAFPAPPPYSLQDTVHLPLQLSGTSGRERRMEGGRAWARAKVLPRGWITMPQCGGECLDTASWERGPRCGCATLSNLPLKSEFWSGQAKRLAAGLCATLRTDT